MFPTVANPPAIYSGNVKVNYTLAQGLVNCKEYKNTFYVYWLTNKNDVYTRFNVIFDKSINNGFPTDTLFPCYLKRLGRPVVQYQTNNEQTANEFINIVLDPYRRSLKVSSAIIQFYPTFPYGY